MTPVINPSNILKNSTLDKITIVLSCPMTLRGVNAAHVVILNMYFKFNHESFSQ